MAPDVEKLPAIAMALVQAADSIQSHIIRQRLQSHPSIQDAYRDGGMVTAEINAILAETSCADLLAPVYEAYADEKARILGKTH